MDYEDAWEDAEFFYLAEEEAEYGTVSTPYDDAFRTMLVDCPALVIPVINEIFGKHYRGDEKIIQRPNEHFLNRQGGEEERRITDSVFAIVGETVDRYLFECQSRPDSSMLVRIFEYSVADAAETGELIGNRLVVTIPQAAVLYLRSRRNTPNQMEIVMNTPGGSVSFPVPLMKMKDYRLENIFEKKLYFLLPFYIFTHENAFPQYEQNPEKLKELQQEYGEIMARLDALMESGEMTAYEKQTIIDMAKRVLESIARKFANVREGVDSIMGGRVLEHEAHTILTRGIAQGIEIGQRRGEEIGQKRGEEIGRQEVYKRLIAADFSEEQARKLAFG